MRRLIGRIVDNWPLKLAAVGLASLMYGGLALSQNTQTYQGVIPVRYVNQPADTVVLPSTPLPVTQVRYFAPTGVQVATSSFLATIDLSGQEGKVGVVSVKIDVTTPDSRINVLGYEPAFATVELDGLTSLDVPVKVVHGPVPDGLTLGTTTVDPETVTITGAASLVAQVDAVRADVAIQSAGLDVDEDVQLVPIDELGNAVEPARRLSADRAGGHPGLLRPPEPDAAGQPDHHRQPGGRVRDRIRHRRAARRPRGRRCRRAGR